MFSCLAGLLAGWLGKLCWPGCIQIRYWHGCVYYTVGVLLWLSHPAALNLASAQLSKHNATAGRQHLHILIKLQIIARQKQQNTTDFPGIQLSAFLLICPYAVITLVLKWGIQINLLEVQLLISDTKVRGCHNSTWIDHFKELKLKFSDI